MIDVPAGKPVRSNEKFAVASVMAPAESRVRFIVILAVPRALVSALVIGGFSFAALNAAVKLIVFGGVDGPAGLSLPHAAARMAAPASNAYLFIVSLPDGNQNLRVM